MRNFYSGKSIFITGAAGTIGKELIKNLIKLNPKKIVAIDNNETEIFFLLEKYKTNHNVYFFICDIRDKDKLKFLIKDCDFVFHGAALKHVILGEYNSFDIVQTNLIGLQNVIEVSIESNVQKVLFMSSDKAVNPTNAMGASKLMGEKLVTTSNNLQSFSKTVFCSTRFGNVLGSRGSVVPIFLSQLKNGLDLTVTDPNMTRFIMKKEDAVRLILESMKISKGGETFILKMDSIKIIDLAYAMIEEFHELFGINMANVTFIGSKPGEKMFEELLNEEEIQRTKELKDFFVILPAFKSIYFDIDYNYNGIINENINIKLTSHMVNPLTKGQIKKNYIKHIKENIDEYN
jgi:FlaA1/EpsC-like NDP-sugar epimerase